MGNLIVAEIGFLIGTVIFFTGLWLKDEITRRKRQKLIDMCGPPRFINSSAFATMIRGKSIEEASRLFEYYKDR